MGKLVNVFQGLRRAFAGVALVLLAIAAWCVCRAGVVINEIHYNPDVETEPAEFVELFNPGEAEVDLAGWRLTDAVQFVFPNVRIAAGGYLVVAQDPSFLKTHFGAEALGPYLGGLSGQGEVLVLRDASGSKVDEVDYQLGFPWPTVGGAPGYSIELIHPGLDNSLGGNWRASVAGGATVPSETILIQAGSSWRFRKGTAEASQPVSAWRQLDFDDTSWVLGATPIGYDPALVFGTELNDMRGKYASVFLRRTFTVSHPGEIASLAFDLLYDDGIKVWINGTNVLNLNIDAGEVAYNGPTGPARESNAFDPATVDNPGMFLRAGENVIAVQLQNVSIDSSSDCFFDCRLVGRTGPAAHGPTPGRLNSVFATNAPPAVRQVEHAPKQPHSGEPVLITCKVTDPDGVSGVKLQYQRVDPGSYIELTDAEYETQWSEVPMRDDGNDGDAVANDGVFTTQLPASVQANRRLIRYRITAMDAPGLSVRVPYADDPQPNFAYFVYDGVPAWGGAVKPGDGGGLGRSFTVGADAMGRLQTIHLLGKRQSTEQSTWLGRYGGDAYPWLGTLVYDGEVYDHIHHRARGGVWRYAMCKNMWKFDLNRGHDFQARDNWGRKFGTKWTKLNLGACIQQGDYNHRGEQGMFESVGLRLFQLAGVPAPNTSFAQFRIVDGVNEVDPASQYEGDFWGVYLMVEQENGRFLEEHGLADSNFYKMEGGTGDLNNLGPLGPTDKSDLNPFLAVANGGGAADVAWWRTNLNLTAYFSYQTVVQAIHHYDICYDKNYFYHFNPTNRMVTVTPWDLDLTWAENMYDAGCGGVDRIKARMIPNGTRYPVLWREWQNRVREVRDLLWNQDEAWRLIDEQAGLLRGPTNAPSILDADRAQWDYNPRMIDSRYSTSPGSKAGQGRYYQWPNEPGVSKDFNGCVQLMKSYVGLRSSNPLASAQPLDQIANDPAIPSTPAIAYTGPVGYPVNALAFSCTTYGGTVGFGSMQWRIGEVTRPGGPSWQSSEPWKYEIQAVWTSGDLTAFAGGVVVPSGELKPGRAYRARVRFKDAEGRASHWSAPIEFVAGQPDNLTELKRSLRVTELMYNAAGGSGYDFVELHNANTDTNGASSLDLGGVVFAQGISYTFPVGTALPPGGYIVVCKADPAGNFGLFRSHYRLGAGVAIYGPYDGNLSDNGETLTVRAAAGGTDLVSFEYRDGAGWPLAADGAGHSLVPRRDFGEASSGMLDFGGNWRASAYMGGSPGRADPEPEDVVVLNEIASNTGPVDDAVSNDWVELFNRARTNLTLGAGWFLSDSAADLKKWEIPSATVVPARGYVSFDEITGFHRSPTTGFGISSAGERVFLSFLPGDPRDRVVDVIAFSGQEVDWSFARSPDGGDYWDYVRPRSRDTANTTTTSGRVIISEIMYHTGFATNLADSSVLEFVELLNGAAVPVSLFNSSGVWRVGGGIAFAFPADTVLTAGERVVVVPFDPADTTALGVFRNAYGLGEGVRVFGPFSGHLDNDTDRVTIERPLAPEVVGGFLGTVVADEVIYFDSGPWPGGADGNGASYNRLTLEGPGSDPLRWFAAPPSPGREASTMSDDADGDGMPGAWERAHGLDPADASDAALDPDHDGLSNLEEFRAGTDPHENSVRLDARTVEGGLEFSFLAPAGRSTAIERSDDLVAGVWGMEPSSSAPSQALTTVRTVRLAVPTGTLRRFYRVRMQ